MTGDESTTWNAVYPNTTGYLVGCSARKVTRPGVALSTEAIIAESRTYYDGASVMTTPPLRCDPTTSVTHLATTPTLKPNYGDSARNISPYP